MDVRKMLDLTGRVAVVTGGSGIYGTAISEALAEAGAHVMVASRNKTRCKAWAAGLVQRGLKASEEGYDQASEESIGVSRP